MRSCASLISFAPKSSSTVEVRVQLTIEHPPKLRRVCICGALAPQNIVSAIFRCGDEPGRGILRHATEFPYFQCTAEGVLYDVFCQLQIVNSEDTSQHSDHTPRFMPKNMIGRFHLLGLAVEYLNRTHFHGTLHFEDRATFLKFHCLLDIAGASMRVAGVGLGLNFGFCVQSVSNIKGHYECPLNVAALYDRAPCSPHRPALRHRTP